MSFWDKIPIIGDFTDSSAEDAQNELKKNQALYSDINLPSTTWQNYTPENYRSAGDYTPTDASYQTISEDPTVRSAQLSALSKMSGLADTGLSDVDEATFAKAASQAGQQSRAGTQAAMENARNRGVAGGGLEFALSEMANQGAQGQAQQAMLDRASAAAQERAMYTQAYGSGLQNLRSQDASNAAANAGIINQFNMANTNAANQAQQYNLQNSQAISNANIQGHNTAQQYNQQGQQTLAQQNFNNQLAKANGQSGANTASANGYYAQSAANAGARKAVGSGVGAAIGYGSSDGSSSDKAGAAKIGQLAGMAAGAL